MYLILKNTDILGYLSSSLKYLTISILNNVPTILIKQSIIIINASMCSNDDSCNKVKLLR